VVWSPGRYEGLQDDIIKFNFNLILLLFNKFKCIMHPLVKKATTYVVQGLQDLETRCGEGSGRSYLACCRYSTDLMDSSMDSIDSSSASKEQNLGATTVGQQNEAGPNTFSEKCDTWMDAGTSSATLAAATSPHSEGKRAPSLARVAMIGRAHAQMQRPGEVGIAGVETEGGQRLSQMCTNIYADGDACNHMSEGGSFRSNFSGRGNGEGSHKRLVSNYGEW
jgi:hypothetical protein